MKNNKFWLGIVLCIILSVNTYAQNSDVERSFDVFNITLEIDKVGRYNMPISYESKSKIMYLPVLDLFDVLKIYNNPTKEGKLISGYISDKKNIFEIDFEKTVIRYKNQNFALKNNEFIYDTGVLYVSREVLETVFGFRIKFDFRNLAASLSANFEFPVIKQMLIEESRNRLSKTGNAKINYDQILSRDYHWLRLGMVDWSTTTIQSDNSTKDNRFGLGMGSELLGGEANVWLNHSTVTGLNLNQQRYIWQWVNNNSDLVKQIQVGRVYTKSISTLLSPLDGMSISNTPTTIRKSLGDYVISDYTKPDWLVELYINKALVAYVKSDAAGYYTFKVPIAYGVTNVVLKFYGPNGEEHTEEKVINMPFNFLPKGEVEYKFTGGYLLDSVHSRYGRAELSYGISRKITVSAGVEYSQAIQNQDNSPYIPFFSASIQPFPVMNITGEYAHNVRTKGLINFTPGNLNVEVSYAKFTPNQSAIIYKYLDELVANLSVPFNIKGLSGFIRSGYRKNGYENFTYNAGEFMTSVNLKNLNINLSNYGSWTSYNSLNIYSNLGLSYRFPHNFNSRINGQYNFTTGDLLSLKAELEKQISRKGYVSVGYENSLLAKSNSLIVSLRYDFSFMSTSLTSFISKNLLQFSENASGSFAMGSGKGYIRADKQNSIGRSGVSIEGYVDANFNGKRDYNEPLVNELGVKCNGGQIMKYASDSITRIFGLEPYTDYALQLDETKFTNPSWKIKQKNIKIITDPNQFKKILIAILPMGEVSGTVRDLTNNGIGRVIVRICTKADSLIAQTYTESDGYFSYLGLKPGIYIIKGDSAQFKSIGKYYKPIEFVIKSNIDGDVNDVGNVKLVDILKSPKKEQQNISETAKESNGNNSIVLSHNVVYKDNGSELENNSLSSLNHLISLLNENNKIKVNITIQPDGRNDITNREDISSKIDIIRTYFSKYNISIDRFFINHAFRLREKNDTIIKPKDVSNNVPIIKSNTCFTFNKIKNQRKGSSSIEDVILSGYENNYHLQICVYKTQDKALKLAGILKQLNYKVIIVNEDAYYKVRLGSIKTEQEANIVSEQVFKLISW